MYEPVGRMIVALSTARQGFGGLRTWFGAIADLGDHARFYSNGDWPHGSSPSGWRPLTDAAFDTGVIGHNESVGFMFWADEED